jgi:hypothetical protein
MEAGDKRRVANHELLMVFKDGRKEPKFRASVLATTPFLLYLSSTMKLELEK